MAKYRLIGRRVGAIGVFYDTGVIIDAEDHEQAFEKYTEEYAELWELYSLNRH